MRHNLCSTNRLLSLSKHQLKSVYGLCSNQHDCAADQKQDNNSYAQADFVEEAGYSL